MKVVICGSRGVPYRKYLACQEFLSMLHQLLEISTVLEGGASGADQLGAYWAKDRDIPVITYPAAWNIHGKKAGFIRNAEMVAEADAVIALWNGKSKGTKHSIDLAVAQNKPCYIYKF